MKKVKILALISAVVTAVLLFTFLNSLNRPMEIEKTSVLTAIVDIPSNTRITSEMIQITQIPSEAVIKGTVTNSSLVLGKISEEKIFTGEQILSSKLVSVGKSGSKTLAYAIKPGMRAITMAVDITSGLSNMIIPGNHIDLIGEFLIEKIDSNTVAGSGMQKKSYTTMLLQNITVLAVDNVLSEEGKVNSETPSYATLTLQVTPKQALELSMAQFEGQLRIILRSPLDEKITDLKSITLDNILVK